MTELAGRVQQQSYGINVDGPTVSTVKLDREGALFGGTIEEKYRQWLMAGKVFEAHMSTIGTTATMEANATLDLTEPFHRCTVPSSHVLVPISFKISFTTVMTTVDTVFLTASDTGTYTSGGVAPSIRNMAVNSSLDSALGTTALTNHLNGDSALTEAALTNPRMFGHKSWVTGDVYSGYEYNILKGDPMVMIHGPSSFTVQAILTGAKEVHYTFVWAELDKNALVNS